MSENNELEPEFKSKSQRKREMQALQELGDKLVKLSQAELNRLALPQPLRDAVDEARRIKAREGLRRQMQYIGRLMREVDAEPIRQSVEALEQPHRREVKAFHALERWRERLLQEGDDAVEAFIGEHPAADRQRLRQMVRAARKAQSDDAAARSSRQLFRYLKESSEAD